jgi:hypothetical protein
MKGSAVMTEDALTGTHRYAVYGIGLHSDLDLPPLQEATDSPCDIRVRVTDPVSRRPGCDADTRHFSATRDEAHYHWGELGTLRVRGGCDIELEPVKGADPTLLRLWIQGPGLALALSQQGKLLLHASSVDIFGRGAVFLGPPGAGKSTLAAALVSRGHRLLADDISLVAPGAGSVRWLHPGFSQIKLWPDASEAVTLPVAGGEFYPDCPKQLFRLPPSAGSTPVPLHALYTVRAGDALDIQSLSPTQALEAVLTHWYGARFGLELLKAIGVPDHFRRCVRTLEAVRTRALTRPSGSSGIDATAAAIETDFITA